MRAFYNHFNYGLFIMISCNRLHNDTLSSYCDYHIFKLGSTDLILKKNLYKIIEN